MSPKWTFARGCLKWPLRPDSRSTDRIGPGAALRVCCGREAKFRSYAHRDLCCWPPRHRAIEPCNQKQSPSGLPVRPLVVADFADLELVYARSMQPGDDATPVRVRGLKLAAAPRFESNHSRRFLLGRHPSFRREVIDQARQLLAEP
jgi:hypothetical protein